MPYYARIVLLDGNVTYLGRGRRFDLKERATAYPHPSNARQALKRWLAKGYYPGDKIADVVTGEGEDERTVD